tara:strand:- start:68 stop:247 length:180 start_codon:yes stop_codon:yes gene_type:complete
MRGMFNGAQKFNQSLNDWNVSSVRDMSSMFANATSFKKNKINKWPLGNEAILHLFVQIY